MSKWNPFSILLVVLGLSIMPAASMAAGTHGTADEAKAMVQRAVAYIKEVGAEKAFATINDKSNKMFHDRDLYVYVRTFDGNTVAHGSNVGMIGHTNLEFKDADGKLYVKEIVEKAKSAGTGWVDYRFPNPVSKKIEPKSTYLERVGDYVVCAGFYKE